MIYDILILENIAIADKLLIFIYINEWIKSDQIKKE